MGSPATGALRIFRALSLALVMLALSLAGHLVGGGTSPPPGVLLALALLVAFGCVIVTAKRCRAVTLVAVLGIGQLGLHAAFEALGRPVTGSVTGGHHEGEHLDAVATAAPMSHATPLWMTACHAIVAVLCAVVLARGEAALWALVARVAPRLPRLFRPAASHRVPLGVTAARITAAPVRLAATPVRGPPAVLSA